MTTKRKLEDIEESKTKHNQILRAHMWHEEGVYAQFFDYLLPDELPRDLDPSLAFLQSIIPTVGCDILATHKTNDNTERAFYDKKDNQQFAFRYEPVGVELFDSDTSISFFTLIEKLCGKPVVGGTVGTYHTVFIPTYE